MNGDLGSAEKKVEQRLKDSRNLV